MTVHIEESLLLLPALYSSDALYKVPVRVTLHNGMQ